MTKNKAHGPVTHREPNNGLPKWVKKMAASRGYADSLDQLSLYVTEKDIDNAYNAAGQGNGFECVMAQAGRRLGAESVYFYRTTAWIDFGKGPILRFTIPESVSRNIIKPFDKGEREQIAPGLYPLTPPCKSQSLQERRNYDKTGRKAAPQRNRKKKVVAHTDRVVLAPRQEGGLSKTS
jgi:hypothetical protein